MYAPHTAFLNDIRLAHGSLGDIAVAVRNANTDVPILIFNDRTGRQIDVDTRGSDDEIRARYAPPPEPPRGRGRPKLGVVPREVTLLPRHWEWLNAQPGGASAALRRLVDEARGRSGTEQRARTRAAHEAAYAFMHAIAGNFPGFEEATRALFANDKARLAEQIAHWPHDVRAYAMQLATVPSEDEG
jgi:uncharacterized protein